MSIGLSHSIVPATRSDQLGDLGIEDLVDDGEPNSDRQRQQALHAGPGEFAEGDRHSLRRIDRGLLGRTDDV
jgi:hypothetical protein